MTNADRLVELYILDAWRADNPDHADCPSLRVVDPDASNGTYGCETGCDYTTFTATVGCEHRQPAEYVFGEFGELASILENVERDYGDAAVRSVAKPSAIVTWFE